MNRTMIGMATVSAALFCAACTIVPPRVEYTGPRIALVTHAPPPPRVEVIPVQPGPNVFWVPGHWDWDGRGHRWEDGRWEPRRERERWVPHHWDQEGDGRWRQSGGYWHRD